MSYNINVGASSGVRELSTLQTRVSAPARSTSAAASAALLASGVAAPERGTRGRAREERIKHAGAAAAGSQLPSSAQLRQGLAPGKRAHRTSP